MSGKKFDGIDALVDDIKANYLYAEFGNRYDGKYRVTTVASGALLANLEKLKRLFSPKRDVKIIFLVAEEIDGQQTQCF